MPQTLSLCISGRDVVWDSATPDQWAEPSEAQGCALLGTRKGAGVHYSSACLSLQISWLSWASSKCSDTKCLCLGLWTLPKVSDPQLLSEARGPKSKSASQVAEKQSELYWHQVMKNKVLWDDGSPYYRRSQEHSWNGCLTIPNTACF